MSDQKLNIDALLHQKRQEVKSLHPVPYHYYFFISLILLAILIFLGAGLRYRLGILTAQTVVQDANQKFIPAPTEYPTTIPTPSKQYALIATRDSQEQEYYRFTQDSLRKIFIHEKYLFIAEKLFDSNEPRIKASSINLETGEITSLFDSLEYRELESNRSSLSSDVTDFRVIGNRIYLSIGGYMNNGGVLMAPFPPAQKMELLFRSMNARFETYGSTQFLVQGEGDGCGGMSNYSRLNNTGTEIAASINFNFGCSEGDALVGVDPVGRQLLAMPHTWNDSDGSTYTALNVVGFDNLSASSSAITAESMPEKIHNAVFNQNTRQLLMFSFNGIYLFDASSNKLSQLVDHTIYSQYPYVATWDENLICLNQIKEFNWVNPKTGEYGSDLRLCTDAENKNYIEDNRVNYYQEPNLFDVNLPENLRFELINL